MEEILHQAERLEKEYDWLGATDSYKKAFNLLSEDDLSRKGDVTERLGYTFYHAAFQAEKSDTFQERMRQAVLNYEKAKEFYMKMAGPGKVGRMFCCDAMIAYIGYWLASEVSEKKRLIEECWRLMKVSLVAFEESGENREFGRTFNQLSNVPLFAFFIEWNYDRRRQITKEAISHVEGAIKFLSVCDNSAEVAKAYVAASAYLELFGYYFMDTEEKGRYIQKAGDYWQKADELSEETALLELSRTLGIAGMEWGEGSDRAIDCFEKALELGRKTGDRLIIGSALECLGYHSFWRVYILEEQEDQRKAIEKALRCAEDAKNNYAIVSFMSPTKGPLWAESPQAEYYCELATIETNLERRRELLARAAEESPQMLKLATDSACPENILHAHHVLSKAFTSLAVMETDPEHKRSMLGSALEHRSKSLEILERTVHFDYWDHGVMLSGLANTKRELAKLAGDVEQRKSMLREAIFDEENALKLRRKNLALTTEPTASMYTSLGNELYKLGGWMNELYVLAEDKECTRRSAQAFADAAESFQKSDMRSRMAECFWKAGCARDDLNEHQRSAQYFDLAALNYRKAAEKIPQFEEFYLDHAAYMQAWGEIEKARHDHVGQEYVLAKEHFEKAADLHKSLKHWNYLAPNYAAWSELEKAEELSRAEQDEEARKSFEQAARLFDETRKSIQSQLHRIEDADEKLMATNMLKATDTRHEYCEARIAVEDAKILDKKGDHYSSSKKYGSAAETFEKISQRQESEQEKREIQFITILSRAWQKMTMAEAEASPTLYAEASELFEQIRDYAPNEKTKMLVLGHSRFCKALKAGTEFADTRDQILHAAAVQHLASASNYYMKADFQTASEYAKATKLVFDAYAYMDSAERETDPDKKAKLYTMVERVLQTSAGSFTKAEHPEKREQVLKLLETAREERELATSLTEALHASSIVSATTVFASPTPTKEEAVGSERFENADIQANLIIPQKELKVGELLNLEIELVNAGKGPALLIKVNQVIPEGFELCEKPETCRVEDSYIDMKGKRLAPLKTEELRLVLKPKVQGTFALKPTILYLDENGKYKSHELETVTIIVRELGIKGWLKGER